MFFPLLGFFGTIEAGDTEESVAAILSGFLPQVAGLYATLDGVPIKDLFDHLEVSPLFSITVPPDGLFDAGTYSALSAGYWLMLEPLSRGQHTLSFGGATLGDGFFADTNLSITVTPEPGSLILLLAGAAVVGLRGARQRYLEKKSRPGTGCSREVKRDRHAAVTVPPNRAAILP